MSEEPAKPAIPRRPKPLSRSSTQNSETGSKSDGPPALPRRISEKKEVKLEDKQDEDDVANVEPVELAKEEPNESELESEISKEDEAVSAKIEDDDEPLVEKVKSEKEDQQRDYENNDEVLEESVGSKEPEVPFETKAAPKVPSRPPKLLSRKNSNQSEDLGLSRSNTKESVPKVLSRTSSRSEDLPKVPSRASTHSEDLPKVPSRASTHSEDLPKVPSRASTHSEDLLKVPSRASTQSEDTPKVPSRTNTSSADVPSVPKRPAKPPLGKKPAPPVPKKPSSKILAFQNMLAQQQQQEFKAQRAVPVIPKRPVVSKKSDSDSDSEGEDPKKSFMSNLNNVFSDMPKPIFGQGPPIFMPKPISGSKSVDAEEEGKNESEKEEAKPETKKINDLRRNRVKMRSRKLPSAATAKVEEVKQDKFDIYVEELWETVGTIKAKVVKKKVETESEDEENEEKKDLDEDEKAENAEKFVVKEDAVENVEQTAEFKDVDKAEESIKEDHDLAKTESDVVKNKVEAEELGNSEDFELVGKESAKNLSETDEKEETY